MSLDKYNTAVRLAMSDKYVEYGKERCKIGAKINELDSLLNSDEGKKLPYETYVKLQNDLAYYEQAHERLSIQQDIWGQARDICMDIADEML